MGIARPQKSGKDFGARRWQGGGVGADIRALRKSRAITLGELADKLGRSVGFVSQIERGISHPSIDDLRTIAKLFGVPLSFLFGEHQRDPLGSRFVVRAGARRQLGSTEGGLIEELLSPDLSGSFEIIRSEFLPGSALAQPVRRNTEEAGYVVSGKLEIEIGGEWHVLDKGDSFRFFGEPYRWRNRGKVPAVLIWVIAPPTY
ncbi:MAG: XRE family transcriptional regulator [Erythrobacter sp.]|nr:XRE family transcriptional regulator [Erythrobacter sp.]